MKEIVKEVVKKHGWFILGLTISLTVFDAILNKNFSVSALLLRFVLIVVLEAIPEIIEHKNKKN